MGSKAEPRPPAIFFVYTDKIEANFRKFWHLHLHHSLENSRTFQDQTHFTGLSTPGPGNFTKRNPGLCRRRGTLDDDDAEGAASSSSIHLT